MRALVLLQVCLVLGFILAAIGAPLRSTWAMGAVPRAAPRSVPKQALLFESCTLSSDKTILHGTIPVGTSSVICTHSSLSYAVGCLTAHQAYMCNGAIWVVAT